MARWRAGREPVPGSPKAPPATARQGLSQEALAYEAGVNRTCLSKLEKGASYVGLEIIGKLATVLGVEPAELLRTTAPVTGRG